jgi:uncharacterized protein with NRDE domain
MPYSPRAEVQRSSSLGASSYVSILSLGHLLQDFLQPQTRDALGLPEAVNRLTGRNSEPYAGFNMLLLDPTVSVTTGSIDYVGAFVTNHGGGGVITSRPLSSPECQCGALSNGIDGRDAGAWPKVQVGLAALDAVMHRGKMDEKDLVEELFNLLRLVSLVVCLFIVSYVKLPFPPSPFANVNITCVSWQLIRRSSWKSSEPPETRAQLRNTIMIDPLALAPKPHAASTEPRYYGTRLSTVVLVSRETNRVTFIERDIWGLGGDGKPVMGEVHQQREFRFDAQLGVGTS